MKYWYTKNNEVLVNNNLALGVSVPWTPSIISTEAWYDISDSDNVTESGGVLQTITDKSGNGHDLSYLSGKEPVYPVDFNGLDSADWDGVNDTMNQGSAPFPAIGESDLVIVAVFDNFNTVAGNYSIYTIDQATSSRINVAVSASGYRFFFNGTTLTYGSYETGKHIVSAVRALASDYIGISYDGIMMEQTPTITSYTDGSQHNLGSRRNGFYDQWEGLIGEVVIAKDSTTATRQKIEGYLAWKWGLVSNLPVDHPYKNSRPTT